ncbi:MAG: hypothetical protein A2X94_06625 [Bdellovibrionales bacterium GWB1_55_8]|nr:MAG: hypothetical protein A2X94_06625 [Bdellovibrionales bacterium GWB1_55_8]
MTEGNGASIAADVIRVVDGDTIKVGISGGQLSVRMLSIDTPETNFQGKNQGAWAMKASAFLARQVAAGDEVEIEFEGDRCDKFGRILGHVHYDGVHLNRLMVEQGYAVNYCIYPNFRYCADFGALVARNIQARRGMFSDPSVEIPYVWRRTISHQPWDKFTGNIESKEVFAKDEMSRVPVAWRVFFYNEEDILPPYELVD